jgi:hypothetical protein
MYDMLEMSNDDVALEQDKQTKAQQESQAEIEQMNDKNDTNMPTSK